MNHSKKEAEILRIVNTITKAVAEQRLPPGTRLVEAQLVESLQANRNHVRSALQRLSLRRIVSIETNRGASIAKPSVKEARDIFAARSVVEPGVMEILLRKFSKMDIALLRKQLEVEQKAIHKGRREDVIRESGYFHILLAKLSGNQVLMEILSDLITRSSLILSLYQRRHDPQCGCDEHLGIIKAIESRDIQAAVSCMSHHLEDIEMHLNLDFWENKKVDFNAVFGGE